MGFVLYKLNIPHPAVSGQGQFYFLWNLQWGERNSSHFWMHHVVNAKNSCTAEKSYSLVLAVLVLRGRQDEGCNGFALVFLSAPVTAACSCISRCLSTRVRRASLPPLPSSPSYAQGPRQVVLKPPPAITPCCSPGSSSWPGRYRTVSYAYCFVPFKRFCCTDVSIVSHQRRTMRHVEGMRPWLSCVPGDLFFCTFFFCLKDTLNKSDPSATYSSACSN